MRTAHGDAWQGQGRLRAPYGGGVCAVRGARAMASGIRAPKWNNADVTHEQVDLAALSAWYGSLGVPWGLRVPLEIPLTAGAPLFVKRCMGLLASRAEPGLRRLDRAGGVRVRRVGAEERDRFVALEVAAFGEDPATARAWLAPQFGVAGFDHWVAEHAGTTVGIATSVRSDELAGPAVMLTGVAALPGADARLVKARLAAHLSAQAAPAGPGATLVHLYPDDDEEEEAVRLVQPA
ncbi:MAG TPA: hypothetical protein VJ966_19720 [Actinomycetes bacterium]|nr:hypothetical protein [Actinomycetes bacterium]